MTCRLKPVLFSLAAAAFLSGSTAPASPTAQVTIEDFEQGISPWKHSENGLFAESDKVHEGMQAARFALDEGSYAERVIDFTDWSAQGGLSFWMYSPAPTDAVIGLVLTSHNPDSEGWVYFYREISIDWSGWKNFFLRKDDFRGARSPSWSDIRRVRFSVTDWKWVVPSPGDAVVIDDLRLLPKETAAKEETK
ncbi:MAG TPA: carbohydrate binding domain-containing protein [Chthoniobacteraceae bacterium]|nr:carbohydrate binding domain-containing protein [Chthoniobacteraceae bacterium]